MKLALAMGWVLMAWVAQAQPSNAAATQLHNSEGESRNLAAYLGKPVIVIYEDKNSQSQNEEFKKELSTLAQNAQQVESVRVLAIADLHNFDWFPARQFAQAAVRKSEKQFGIPILVDWNGTMYQAPWSLPPEKSSVLVLDATGNVLFQRSGSLTTQERAEAISLVRQLVTQAGVVNGRPVPQ